MRQDESLNILYRIREKKVITLSYTENIGEWRKLRIIYYTLLRAVPCNHLISDPVGPEGSEKEIIGIFCLFPSATESPRAEQMSTCCYSASSSHYSAALERKNDLLLPLTGIRDGLNLILN